MSYIPYTKNPSGIAFFGSSSSDSLLRSDSRLSFDSNTGRLLISGVSVSTSGHQHQSSDIINFASSISGLIPVKGISAGTGIVLSSDSGIFTINVSGNFGLTGEEVDDRVSGLLIGNSGIVLTYDDLNNKLFISTSGLQPSGNYSTVGHTHASSNITDFNSSVSGLFPKIANSGNNRILTSTGSTIGINAEDKLTFDGNKLICSGEAIIGDPTYQSIEVINGVVTVRNEGSILVDFEETRLASFNIDSINWGERNLINSSGSTILNWNDQAVFSANVSAPTGNFTVLQQNGVNVSVSGHSHTSSQITDFNSSVSGLINGIYAPLNSPILTGVPLAPTAISGTNTNQIASTSFVRTEISNLVNSAPSTLDTLNELASALGNDANFSTTVTNSLAGKANLSGATFAGSISGPSGDFTNLRQNGVIVSVSGHSHAINDVSGLQTALDNKQPSGIYASGIHTHTSSDITNFDTSVSGLLPVKNIIAGYDINITNNSGVYTVASTNLVHVDSQQPQGFVNRTDSRISVSGNIFTIEPTGSSYSYYNKGIKVVKTSGDSLTIPNLTQINYIHFDTINNQISNKTTGFDFSTDIPIAYIAWNSGVGPSGQMTFFAEERHGIVMDTSTHKWIHYTFGAQYVGGLSIGNYVLGGNGSSNSHATISIGNGTLYQEDIEINITDSSSTDPFCQELSPIAQIPVYYHQGTTGQWVKNTATDYPVKYGANGPQYNLLTDGNWTTPDVSPGGATRYFAVWILATNQIDDPIISIMGQRIDSNQGSAESHNSWSDVNLTNLPLSEVKPLYRLIFAGDSDYTNVPKCTLLSILDIRVSVISTIAGVTQNDHGSLFGLGDDDHSQYLHVDNARTVNAIHNFVNGLTVNGTGVSVSGHSHIASDISNFSSSVSGLLPSNLVTGSGVTNHIPYWSSNSGLLADSNQLIWDSTNNRLGIGTTTPSGQLHVIGSGIFSSGIIVGNGTVTNPSIVFDGSRTTGFSATSNLLEVSVLGNRAMRISQFGTVAINRGTGSALGTLHVQGNGSNPANPSDPLIVTSSVGSGSIIRFTDSASNDWQIGVNPNGSVQTGSSDGNFAITKIISNSGLAYVTINSSGNIGIGTTTPSGKLHVIGTGIFSSGIISNSDINSLSFIAGSGSAASPSFDFINDSDTGLFSPAANTIAISTSGVERLRVNDIGNVGIGTSFPQNGFKLDIAGNSVTRGNILSNGSIIEFGNSRYQLSSAAASNSYSYVCNGGGNFGVGFPAPSGRVAVSGGVAIGSNYNFTPPSNGLIVEGNVGIGTISPSGQLHVLGTGIISSRLGINNNNPQYSLDVSGSGNFLNGLAISGVPIGEVIDDEVAGLLVAGSGISLNYNDSANTLTVDTNVSTSLVAGTGIALSYNVTTDELSINTSGVSLVGHTHSHSDVSNVLTTLSQFTTSQNDLSLGSGGIIRMSSSGTLNITGFVATSGGDARLLSNVGSGTITLKHNDSGSSANNRILCVSNTDFDIETNGSAAIYYDNVDNKWRVG